MTAAGAAPSSRLDDDALSRAELLLPVDACYHCGRRPEADGDHTCPCPKRDGECPEHDPITTFAEYQRRYTPAAYERARIDALTPEQASRYELRRALREISDGIFHDHMRRQHREFHPVNVGFGGPGCRYGWSACPEFLASLTDDQRQHIRAISDPETADDSTR